MSRDMTALFDPRSLRGRRLAVIADGGGQGIVAASLARDAGLELPALSAPLRRRLRARLPTSAAVANPIDLAGGGEADIDSYARTARAILESGEVDAVLMSGYFGGYTEYDERLERAEALVADAIVEAGAASGRPLLVQTMYPHGAAARALRRGGAAVHPTIERTVWVLGRLAERVERRAHGVPTLPAAAEPITDDGYAAARALLAAGGVPFAPGQVVDGAERAADAAAEIG